MNIINVFKYQFSKFRYMFFPKEGQINLRRWILDKGEEKRYNYNLNTNSLVFDIGGYKGQWASDIYSMYNSRIIIIEPQLDFYNKISIRFANNPRIEVYPIALGNSNREELISYDADASTIFNKSKGKKEKMHFVDVLSFFNTNKIQNVDLMKINIEGGEYELLSRIIETGLVNNIKNIQIQFHDFVPNAKTEMENIQNQLKLTHKLTFQYSFVWENWEIK